jgi:hypothetical protein
MAGTLANLCGLNNSEWGKQMTEVQPSRTPPITLASLPYLRAAYSDRAAALMAKLSGLAYDFPQGNVFPPPNAPIPEEFAELGFEKITYF